MADSSSKLPSSCLVYDGAVFRIEFYVAPSRAVPAEAWLEQQRTRSLSSKSRPIESCAFSSSAGDKTPKREIDRAEACKKDFEGRVKHEG